MKKVIPNDFSDILLKAGKDSQVLADTEAESFSNDDLEKEAKRNDHDRKEGAKTCLHFFNIAIYVVICTGAIIGVCILFFHWLAPTKFHFLTSEQIATIKMIFFSSLATNFFKSFYQK
jgi:hypothetical protein